MAFYNFEVRTPTHVMFTESAEVADSSAARIEASKRIGQLLHDHAGQIWNDEEWQIDVTNESGLILYVIQVTVMKSPAAAISR